MGIGAEEFPKLPDSGDDKTYTLEQGELATMLSNVAYAQSTDETRYILNGVYFNFKDGKLSLVATDGRRLALGEQGTDGSRRPAPARSSCRPRPWPNCSACSARARS